MQLLFLIGSGVVIGLIVAVPIGPVNLICIRRTFAYGALNGFLSGLGATLGDGLFAIITGFGLTAISRWIEGYAPVLMLFGGLLLVGFGLHIFNADVSLLYDAEKPPPRNGGSSLARAIASTFALTITNPATLLGFAALFAGLGSFLGREPTFLDAATTVLGVMAGSALWWFVLATLVGILHRHIDPGVMRNVNHLFGVAVTGFGLVVLGGLLRKLF